MITLEPIIQASLDSHQVRPYLILRIYDQDDNTLKAVTTNSYDLDVLVGVFTETYSANGQIISVDPPKISTDVDRELFTVRLADPEFIEGPYADNGYIGKRMIVRVGFAAEDGYVTAGTISAADNMFIAYKGRIESTSYLLSTKELGESILEITCASPMADLDFKKSIYTSRDFVRGRNVNDTSCDSVFGGSGSLQLKWGRT